MALTTAGQFHEAFARARSVLVVCRPNPSIDEIVSATAIADFLKQVNKRVDIVSDSFAPISGLTFIPEISTVLPRVGQLQQFIISLPTEMHGIESVHHEILDNELKIFVTPKNGVYTTDLVRTATSEFKYDLIVCIGVPDFAALGDVYRLNAPLFSAVPVLALSHAADHEYFGHMNYVDITLTSNAEVVHTLFADASAYRITQPIANMLLTGMIAATQSFKTARVNAGTLQTASSLIALGADRELIVHHLYRQRSVATLKLWGAALTHVQVDPQQPFMWSTLTREDFARAGAAEKDLSALIDELIYTSPHAKVFALTFENQKTPDDISVIIDTQKPYNAELLSSGFTGVTGTPERVVFILKNMTLADATQKIVNVLKAKMRG